MSVANRFPVWFVLTLLLTVNCCLKADDIWRFGKAKSSITPQEFMWMSGYGSRNKPADGKLTELWVKVLALEDRDGNRALLITLDLIGIGRQMSDQITREIQDKYRLSRDRVAICTSHTHTGPALADNLMPLHYLVVDEDQQQLIQSYSQWLKKEIVATVGRALKTMQPARLAWGSGKATFAVNRRNNAEAQVPKLRLEKKLQGPVDHDVPVLAIRDSADRLQAVVFGYACHATVLSFYKWSGDYPGFAQLQLEKDFPECQAMFWAGCGADQNPLPRRQVELAKRYGELLADAVKEVLKSEMGKVNASLVTKYQEIELPLAKLPTKKEIENDAKSANRFIKARVKYLLSEMEKKGKLETDYPYPVQSWTLGNDIQFVFLGGEVVVDFAVRIKSENAGKETWVAGYSNDVMAYIASARVLREGGYEGATAMIYYGLPAPWALESEQLIVDAVNRQIGNGKSKE